MPENGRGDGQKPTAGGLVRDNLLFLLGLAPVLIAMLRVAMAAQGDYGAALTMVRTLDVGALIVGTFVRGVGLLLVAASLYVIVRVYVFRSGRDARPEPTRSLLPIVVVIFVIGGLALYLEELWDTDKLTGWKWWVQPVDLVRSEILILVFCGVLTGVMGLLGIRPRRKTSATPPNADPIVAGAGDPRTGAGAGDPAVAAGAAPASNPKKSCLKSYWSYLCDHLPEVFIIAPVVLYLFWNNAATNERMWLPSEVITVPAAPSLNHSTRQDLYFPDSNHPVIRWKGHTLVIVAYVLASDGQSLTVTTPAGGIYVLPDGSGVTRQVCQDITEPHADQTLDAPFFSLIGVQHTQQFADQTQVCNVVVSSALAAVPSNG